MKKYFTPLLLAVIMLLSSLFGCAKTGESLSYYGYFNTNIDIVSYTNKLSSSDKKDIESILKTANNELSITNENSYISKFNNLKENQEMTFSVEAFNLLKQGITLSNSSSDTFNIALYPASVLWKLSAENYKRIDPTWTPPTEDEIDNIKPLCNIDNITTNDNTLSVKKLVAGTKIDLGGLAKGYIVDKLATICKNAGIVDGYISAGSSSMYIFNVEKLGIRHPRENGTIISILNNINNMSVSSSGDYERYHEYMGIRYSHIISPKTCSPSKTGCVSATIVMDSGTLCDALSTSICLTEEKDIENYISLLTTTYNNCSIFAVYILGTSKKIYTNRIISQDFTLNDSSYQVIKV